MGRSRGAGREQALRVLVKKYYCVVAFEPQIFTDPREYKRDLNIIEESPRSVAPCLPSSSADYQS